MRTCNTAERRRVELPKVESRRGICLSYCSEFLATWIISSKQFKSHHIYFLTSKNHLISVKSPVSSKFLFNINLHNHGSKPQPQPGLPLRLYQLPSIRPLSIQPLPPDYSQQHSWPSLHRLHPQNRPPHLPDVLQIQRSLLFILRSNQLRFLHLYPWTYHTSQLMDLRKTLKC